MEDILKQLETRKITLFQCLGLIEEAVEKYRPSRVTLKEQRHSVLNTNPGFNCLKLIRDVHCKINGILLQTELTPFDIVNMKFAPITSVEVVHSYSQYKAVLRPNRRAFNFKHFCMYKIYQCNQDIEYGYNLYKLYFFFFL